MKLKSILFVSGATIASYLSFTVPSFAQTCSITSVGTLNFGSYDVFSTTALVTTAALQVKCTPANLVNQLNTTTTTSLGKGNSTTFSTRQMQNTTNSSIKLNYNIYTTAGGTTIWGDGTTGTSQVSKTIAPTLNFTIEGIIPAGQNVSVGTYTDSVTITVNY